MFPILLIGIFKVQNHCVRPENDAGFIKILQNIWLFFNFCVFLRLRKQKKVNTNL